MRSKKLRVEYFIKRSKWVDMLKETIFTEIKSKCRLQ